MASYNALNSNNRNPSPYGSGDPYYNESSGFITPHPAPKRRVSPWIKFGVPVLVIVIIAAVVGGVVGSRHSSSRAASNGSGGSSGDSAAAASSAASAKLALGRFATATNSEFEVPLYPSTVSPLLVLALTWKLLFTSLSDQCCLHNTYIHTDH